jgi:hypothetical protein
LRNTEADTTEDRHFIGFKILACTASYAKATSR